MSLQAVDNPEEQAKLVALGDEIIALLKKHDVCGYVQLQGKHTLEYRVELESTWSCITLEPAAGGAMTARFKAAIASGPESERERAIDTIGMLMEMVTQLDAASEMVGKLVSLYGPKLGNIEHISRRIR